MQKSGFTLIEEKYLPEVGGTARLWQHELTGAQVLSIVNEDENKCFGVSFYTPPTDSTGVAHILEHSVLGGSSKYPVKEPFVELLKGSVQTFLNAFTFPDKTCYPVASTNPQDFRNLMDVYLDAVFHPLLSENTFCQEGWHVEAEEADAPWIYKGVVYNEMKGVYSSPDAVLAEKSQQAVFPDNLYCQDSGGNPERIPDLTYQAFRDFHHRYYQPGNARFFFWGDDPEDERLARIDREISGYGKVADLPQLPLQQKRGEPWTVEFPYACAEGEERALFTVNWLLGERADIHEALRMEMLEHILEGLPGSPLRRALMESGLGEDTTGCGLETDLRQMYYSTGLKGVAPANVGKAATLIQDTLADLAVKGIDKAAVDAAINSVEFAYRENNSGRFPRGLAAMIQSLSAWLYGGDPIAPLAWEAPLTAIKKAVASGEKVFENAIKRNFLENSHCVRVTLLPDHKLGKMKDDREKAILTEIQEASSPQKRRQMVKRTQELQEEQLKPNSPEALATIPFLTVADLPKKNQFIPRATASIPQTFISHDLPTSGIAYGTLLLPIPRIPARLLPYLSIFARSLLEWGAAGKDYAQLGMEVAGKLGGLYAAPLTGIKNGSGESFCYLSVIGKSVYDNIPDLFRLMREILLEPQKDKAKISQRLGIMILEDRARLEYSLQMAGHSAVSSRLKAHYRGEGAMAEQLAGISQLCFLRELSERMVNDSEGVLSDLEELRQIIIGSTGAIFDCVAQGAVIQKMEKEAQNLFSALPKSPALSEGDAVSGWRPMDLPKGEAFITPGLVNYVGKGANLYELGYKYKGSAAVITRWLRMQRLWEDVRVAGGAYGAFCSLDRLGGTFVCSSYRDPNVDRTLSAYDGLAPYLRSFEPTRAQLTQAIVGAIGDMDTYMLPDARGAKSLARWISGLTDEELQKSREEMLATTGQDFRDFADALAAVAEEGSICVLGGAQTAESAKQHGWNEMQLL